MAREKAIEMQCSNSPRDGIQTATSRRRRGKAREEPGLGYSSQRGEQGQRSEFGLSSVPFDWR